MKKIVLLITFALSLSLSAQSPYEKGMTKAFDLWEQEKITEATNLFERIAKAEKNNWIPYYYTGYINIMSAFGKKEEAKLQAQLEKASDYLDNALLLSPKNAEIMIIKALKNIAYIAFDGQKYGMSLSVKNTAIYEAAIQIAPNNPRVILGNAEWDMGAARFFGKSTEPYCKNVARALELFKLEEKSKIKFAPSWGQERAEEVLNQCRQQCE